VGREGGEKRGRKGLIIDGVLQGRICSVVVCMLSGHTERHPARS
jgi:hypothetical protein